MANLQVTVVSRVPGTLKAERTARNRENGYYIAEADIKAAPEATIRYFPRADVAWCVLATDGAQCELDHHGIDWTQLHHRGQVPAAQVTSTSGRRASAVGSLGQPIKLVGPSPPDSHLIGNFQSATAPSRTSVASAAISSASC